MNNYDNSLTGCCPVFDPEPFNGKMHVWDNKLFIMDEVRQFLHVPLNINKVIMRMMQKIQNADAMPDMKDFLMLAYDPSPWKSELYIHVTKNVDNANNVKLSGEYFSMAFDAPYKAVPKLIRKMNLILADKGLSAMKMYFYFTTCPKCAKIYGRNYIVAFALIK